MKLANAPCSWGILEFDIEADDTNADQVLSEIQKCGYSGTELGPWGFLPATPGELRDKLAAYGLGLAGAFVPVRFVDPVRHDEGITEALKVARLLAGTSDPPAPLVLSDDNGADANRTGKAGRLQPEDGLSPLQWDTFARGVQKTALAVREETGVPIVFHHHCAGFVETPDEIAVLLDLTDPDLVSLCFDTGHYVFGGGDAVDGVRRFRSRIAHVHFKDCDPAVHRESLSNKWNYFESVQNGIFCELGRGSVDFGGILKELQVSGYDEWIVVEQDIFPGLGSPYDSALRNRRHLETIGL